MPDQHATSELGRAIQEVSERASLLVREEIELAKAEMTEKVTKLVKGAVVGIVAGIFAVFALIYLLHSLSWGIFALVSDDINFVWVGFLITGGLSCSARRRSPASSRSRFIKSGSPPTPAHGDRGGPADQADRADLAARAADRRRRPHRAPDRRPAEASADGRRTHAGGDPALDRGQPRRARPRGRALRGEVAEVTDWRKHLRNNQKQVMIGAAVAGFVLGGGIAAMTGLLTGRRAARLLLGRRRRRVGLRRAARPAGGVLRRRVA